jgi:hypothetical protein
VTSLAFYQFIEQFNKNANNYESAHKIFKLFSNISLTRYTSNFASFFGVIALADSP